MGARHAAALTGGQGVHRAGETGRYCILDENGALHERGIIKLESGGRVTVCAWDGAEHLYDFGPSAATPGCGSGWD